MLKEHTKAGVGVILKSGDSDSQYNLGLLPPHSTPNLLTLEEEQKWKLGTQEIDQDKGPCHKFLKNYLL